MAQTVQLNIRITRELAEEIEQISEQEALRKSDIARKWLIEGLRRWKIDHAVSRYQMRQITLERAAEEAGLALYDMMDELQRRGIALDQTTPEEIRASIKSLLAEA
ncbi:MAG: hypothetical protein GXP42_06190 [Chloroflexi bacterium]|nr:hypothetical protein [Chloroflexota bacterium]